MKHQLRTSLKLFLLELCVYTGLIVAYYFLVLHFLADGLLQFFLHERRIYAVLALALIVGQGLLLEQLTRILLSWIAPRTEDR